jgi:F0F1-type ATP synthase membrane subunit c/vacuolar-type H+-ATPase subunit K
MRRFFEIGGLIAAVVLVAFGIGAIAMGVSGRSTVQSALEQEKIVGSPDMTPKTIAAEAKEAGLSSTIALPTCDVAGVAIDNGDRARCFASYMRIHALEATGGLTYSQMPRFATEDGKGTNDAAAATKGPTGKPLDNPARNIWISETALSTALNSSYMASQTALFGVVVGIALLLSGIGFAILAIGGALRNSDGVLRSGRKQATAGTPATV